MQIINQGVHPFVTQCISRGVIALVGGAVNNVKSAVKYITETLEETMTLKVVVVDMWVPNIPSPEAEPTPYRYRRQQLTFISKFAFPWKVYFLSLGGCLVAHSFAFCLPPTLIGLTRYIASHMFFLHSCSPTVSG